MLIYRIGHKQFIQSLAASGRNGRWTSSGRTVIYGADSIALAFLESMIRRQGAGFNEDFKIAIIEIPGTLGIQHVQLPDLPDGWRNHNDYTICQNIGNRWFDNMDKPILHMPSAVLTSACNYALNTAHPDFKNIKIAAITDLIPDQRIEDILKGKK